MELQTKLLLLQTTTNKILTLHKIFFKNLIY